MIPHNPDPKKLGSYLKDVQAELLIAEAGAVDLTVVTSGNKQLKDIIWVAKEGSRHMNWNEVPAKLAGSVKVAVWHELVQEKKKLEDTEVPAYDPKSATPSITAFWPTTEEFIEYKPQVSPCICCVIDHPFTGIEPRLCDWCSSQLVAQKPTIGLQRCGPYN